MLYDVLESLQESHFLYFRTSGKQEVIDHDQLVQEFETLTTDLDGLLGTLEDTLEEYGSEANFEAKKLLCALFQVQDEYLKQCSN